MAVEIYELQSVAARLCYEAQEAVRQPGAISKVQAIGDIALARIFSLFACTKTFGDVFIKFVHRAVKIIVIPFLDGFSCNSVVRVAIATALIVTLTILRFVYSLGGIVSPELTYGVLKLHRQLLRLGLIFKSQCMHMGDVFVPLGALQNRINEQRLRWEAVTRAEQQIDLVESNGGVVHRLSFGEDIWLPAVGQAMSSELRTIVGEFFCPVNISHPILEAFQEHFSRSLHAEALAVCQQNIYTKDEVEDMVTAFTPIMYRATYRAVLEFFRVTPRDLLLGDRNITVTEVVLNGGQTTVLKDVVLADGRRATVQEIPIADGQRIRSLVTTIPLGTLRALYQATLVDGESEHLDDLTFAGGGEVAGQGAGGLEEWKQQLIEIVLLLKSMPEDDRDSLSYYLCADEEQIRRVKPDLPNISTKPVLDRCFKLIVEFYTAFVAQHMPRDSAALLQAFTLQEVTQIT